MNVETKEVDGRLVVSVSGEVDVHTAPDLRAELQRLAAQGEREIAVDLEGVDFIDSTGLGVLLGAHRQAEEANGTFEIRTTSPRTLKLLRISGLLDRLNVVPPPEDTG